MLVKRSTTRFPNGIGAKSRKYVGPGYTPAPSAVKNNLLIMLVNISENDQVEFTDVKILLFILLVLLFKCKYHYITLYSCDFFFALCLFITQPCFFFIFHQVVRKPFKFINNGIQANKSLANKSNFPSFLSLCVFLFGRRVGKCSSNFCIIINIVWIKTTTFLNVVIFIQTFLSFVLSIKIINTNINVY